jgi:N6-adenosine-specific RNA methylase IME4
VSAPLFAPLPPGPFGAVHIDLPLKFASNSDARPGRNARRHYRCHPPAAFAELPVKSILAKHAWAFAWAPGPFLPDVIKLIDGWGLEYCGFGFTWIKLNPRASSLFFTARDFHFGLGHGTRRNAEVCLLAKTGKPKRLSAKVPELIIAPRREHSRKPNEAFERIEKFCAGPYLDLFGRESRPGWCAFGDEAAKFDNPPIAA